jgi:hypothetical protein
MTTHGHFLIDMTHPLGPAVWNGQHINVESGPTESGRMQIKDVDGRYRLVWGHELVYPGHQIKPAGLMGDARGDSTPVDVQVGCGPIEDVGM